MVGSTLTVFLSVCVRISRGGFGLPCDEFFFFFSQKLSQAGAGLDFKSICLSVCLQDNVHIVMSELLRKITTGRDCSRIFYLHG